MNARTKSYFKAILVGAALGALGLVSRYATLPAADGSNKSREREPRHAAPPNTASESERVDVVASSADAGAMRGEGSSPGAGGPLAARPIPTPRSARFADDQRVMAACPSDMTLVEGELCAALSYACVRRPTEASYRCAEYARGERCFGEIDHRRYCIDRWEWPNRVGENPLVYVDWYEAKALCAERGKRLCRRSEWILACEGPKRLPYPWGFVRQPSPCNIDRATISFDVEAMMRETTREEELARLWQADRIGSHPDCVSAYGAYDLSGNVDEWTDDLADNPASKHPSTLNGGYWGPVRNTCRLTTTSHGPTFKFYQVGFRCCADTIDGVVVPPPRPFIEREPKKDTDLAD